jgi:alkylation response protein AidB-like acyl-CoA dehydrogenase
MVEGDDQAQDARLAALLAVVAAGAEATDRTGRFPEAQIRAFLGCGLAGLTMTAAIGGGGAGLRQASEVVRRIGACCASTAMIITMHYCGAAVIDAHGDDETRRKVAGGQALTTLAFSEVGSRSHFWAPVSTARREGGEIVLDARKSWVTAASEADFYVWSSRASRGEGVSLWVAPRQSAGITPGTGFDGLGLRGNDSAPVIATGARIPAGNLLGTDGAGADIMLSVVLPVFTVLSAAAALGIMDATLARSIEHVTCTGFAHLDQTLSALPTIRGYLARMQVKTDMVRALLADTIAALETPTPATGLRVLEVKAAAGEAATEVTELAMRICGGAAFRKEVGVERWFRDARASTVMAPTSDQLYDFIGRAVCGLDLFT